SIQSKATQSSLQKIVSQKHWLRFKSLNLEILKLYDEIRGLNRFWSLYITIYFASYINEICCLAYAFFFVKSNLGFRKAFFLFFAVQFMAALVIITWECSKIVYKNCVAHRKSQRIALQLQQVHRLRVRDMLKIDAMALNYQNC